MHRCAVGPRQPCILRYSVCTQQDAIFHKKSHNQLHALICCSWVNSVRKIFCSASLGYNTVVPTHFHTNMCLLALIRHWPTTQPGSRARSPGPSLLLYGNVRLPWHILGFFVNSWEEIQELQITRSRSGEGWLTLRWQSRSLAVDACPKYKRVCPCCSPQTKTLLGKVIDAPASRRSGNAGAKQWGSTFGRRRPNIYFQTW